MLFWVGTASLPSCLYFQEYFPKSLEVRAIKQTDWRASGLIMSRSTSFNEKIDKKTLILRNFGSDMPSSKNYFFLKKNLKKIVGQKYQVGRVYTPPGRILSFYHILS